MKGTPMLVMLWWIARRFRAWCEDVDAVQQTMQATAWVGLSGTAFAGRISAFPADGV
jgi:hypothetical protein